MHKGSGRVQYRPVLFPSAFGVTMQFCAPHSQSSALSVVPSVWEQGAATTACGRRSTKYRRRTDRRAALTVLGVDRRADEHEEEEKDTRRGMFGFVRILEPATTASYIIL